MAPPGTWASLLVLPLPLLGPEPEDEDLCCDLEVGLEEEELVGLEVDELVGLEEVWGLDEEDEVWGLDEEDEVWGLDEEDEVWGLDEEEDDEVGLEEGLADPPDANADAPFFLALAPGRLAEDMVAL